MDKKNLLLLPLSAALLPCTAWAYTPTTPAVTIPCIHQASDQDMQAMMLDGLKQSVADTFNAITDCKTAAEYGPMVKQMVDNVTATSGIDAKDVMGSQEVQAALQRVKSASPAYYGSKDLEEICTQWLGVSGTATTTTKKPTPGNYQPPDVPDSWAHVGDDDPIMKEINTTYEACAKANRESLAKVKDKESADAVAAQFKAAMKSWNESYIPMIKSQCTKVEQSNHLVKTFSSPLPPEEMAEAAKKLQALDPPYYGSTELRSIFKGHEQSSAELTKEKVDQTYNAFAKSVRAILMGVNSLDSADAAATRLSKLRGDVDQAKLLLLDVAEGDLKAYTKDKFSDLLCREGSQDIIQKLSEMQPPCYGSEKLMKCLGVTIKQPGKTEEPSKTEEPAPVKDSNASDSKQPGETAEPAPKEENPVATLTKGQKSVIDSRMHRYTNAAKDALGILNGITNGDTAAAAAPRVARLLKDMQETAAILESWANENGVQSALSALMDSEYAVGVQLAAQVAEVIAQLANTDPPYYGSRELEAAVNEPASAGLTPEQRVLADEAFQQMFACVDEALSILSSIQDRESADEYADKFGEQIQRLMTLATELDYVTKKEGIKQAVEAYLHETHQGDEAKLQEFQQGIDRITQCEFYDSDALMFVTNGGYEAGDYFLSAQQKGFIDAHLNVQTRVMQTLINNLSAIQDAKMAREAVPGIRELLHELKALRETVTQWAGENSIDLPVEAYIQEQKEKSGVDLEDELYGILDDIFANDCYGSPSLRSVLTPLR